jgi:D-glycerate 3-kinase
MEKYLQEFLTRQRLPLSFLQIIDNWYLPLAGNIAKQHKAAGRTLLVGINGSQGSGKSTLAATLALLLAENFGLKTVTLSLDDFYHTREARQSLAKQVHPLLQTRGVPGTHDAALMCDTLQRLSGASGEVRIPRFDKARDDRYPESECDSILLPCDVVLFEGWCLGTPAQSDAALHQPVNDLEARDDPDGSWRRYVNEQIGKAYQDVYQLLDLWIMLQAPSFESVYRWRLEQETKLADRLAESGSDDAQDQLMSASQVGLFIKHYQRLTEHSLCELPGRVHYLFKLDEDRNIVAYREPRALDQ